MTHLPGGRGALLRRGVPLRGGGEKKEGGQRPPTHPRSRSEGLLHAPVRTGTPEIQAKCLSQSDFP